MIKKETNAICVIKSWLTSKKIPCIKDKDELLIGRYPLPEIFVAQYKVKLTSDKSDFKDKAFYINIDEILSNDNAVSQKAINVIYRNLLGRDEQFVRTNQTPKAFYQDDFEGAYLRHTDFNRSPNVGSDIIKKYEDVVKSESSRAFQKFSKLSYQAGFERNDLYNIGLVYTISFLHKYDKTETDNRKILRKYLRQRFGHWAETCLRKHKNAMSNNMYISEEHHVNFRNELKLQHEVMTEIEAQSFPEFENRIIGVMYKGLKAKLYIKTKYNQPRYWVNNKEFSQKELVEMLQSGTIKATS